MQTSNQPVLFVFRRVLFIVTGVLMFLIAGINPATAASINGVETSALNHIDARIDLPVDLSTRMDTTLTPIEDVPDGAKFHWVPVFNGFAKPVELLSPPGEPDKIVVVEQGGTIRLVENGAIYPEPFLDIRDRVGTAANEQGLLGLAFDPAYAMNRRIYVNYTDKNGDTVIARFTASADGTKVDAISESRLLLVDQPYDNHNGGGLAFGPDGYLYIGLGDGGSAGDPQNNAQNLNTLLGKLLRVDVNAAQGYAIPGDNPYANGGGKPEIWASGLRNPWKFSFDSNTGDLWIADVGQKLWEEIDFQPAGSTGGINYGWKIMEGSHPYSAGSNTPNNLVNPIFEYDHATGCSITGGFVYRGQSMPEWQGVYIFGDYCKGTIFGLLRTPSEVKFKQVDRINGRISSFGVDGKGEIYTLDHTSGTVYRLEPR